MEEINDNLIKLLNDFNEKYSLLKQSLPYHLNVIDELHINENAHSRILCKLLQYQSESGKYEFLESLLNYIVKNRGVDSFSKIEIKSPKITQEIERIDLWVKDKGVKDKDYAIIFENKVYDATDQEAQIARYINKTRLCDYEDEKIYVIYMPSTGECEASEQTWIDNSDPKNPKNLKETFQERYVKLSFREDILDWLKEHVLPNIKYKDQYLLNAILQYIDYLEGLFDKRTINKNMNMELNHFIEGKLGIINEMSDETKLDKLTKKEEEIQRLLNLINNKKEEINKGIRERELERWKVKTKDYFDKIAQRVSSELLSEVFYDPETSYLWMRFYKIDWNLSIIFEKYPFTKNHTTFIYIGKPREERVDGYVIDNGKKIFREKTTWKAEHPYGWEPVEHYNGNPNLLMDDIENNSFEDYLKRTINKILEKITENNLRMI